MTRCSATCVTGKKCKKYVSKEGLCSVHCNKEVCSVCNEDIHFKDRVTLECNHTFCRECISTWIIQKVQLSSCPNCRGSISMKYRENAYKWGVQFDILFVSRTYYYDFKLLSEIDSYILTARIFTGVVSDRSTCTDELFKRIEEGLKGDINHYEIFKELKKTVTFKMNFFLVKRFPDKPKNMHVFLF
jgi:hypothetical protein